MGHSLPLFKCSWGWYALFPISSSSQVSHINDFFYKGNTNTYIEGLSRLLCPQPL